jgi:hypothetical protein
MGFEDPTPKPEPEASRMVNDQRGLLQISQKC